MEQAKKSAFKFKNFIVEESHIKQKPGKRGEYKIKLLPHGTIYKQKNVFQLDLVVEINEPNKNFYSKIHAIGVFEFEAKTEKKELDNYFLVNAPAIIFPYIRAHIASLTALSGTGAINLPPLNLASLRNQLKENIDEVD